ncbi:MAG: hypothetical protein K0R14_410 [Burkholderiales bacterium]|jgi:YVTN family beta-propeller protein|nr:hypothetical protein [Burkholderiales bacterium]
MKQFKKILGWFIFGLLLLLNSCGGSGGGSAGIASSSPTPSNGGTVPVVTSFSVNGSAGVITGNKIAVTLPYGTDITSLAATFSAPGSVVSVGGIPQINGVTTNNFTNPVVYTITRISSGTNASAKALDASAIRMYTVTVTVASISAKAITAFSLNAPSSTTVTPGIITLLNISVKVPYGTDVTSLVATFTASGADVSINGVSQVSGVTPNDFTNPVTYTVRAADGSTQNYIVTVLVATDSGNDIIAFSLDGTPGVITAGGLAQSIVVKMPYGTNLNGLVATFITTGASVVINGVNQISGTTQNDFTNNITYIVTAANGTVQTYTVTVTVSLISSKFINDFSFGTISGAISGENIVLTVPYGTDVTSLIASFTTTGANVTVGGTNQTSTVTPINFTNPVIYTVTAADGTTQSYTVTVTVSAASAKAITSFAFGLVDGVIIGHNIEVVMPFGTDISDLIATFTITGVNVTVNGVDQISGTSRNSFASPLNYIVTAADGSTATYTVNVQVASSSAKELLLYSLAGASGTYNGLNINIILPSGTNLTNVVATFTTTGASVTVNGVPQFSGTTSNNFTSPVTYVVTAADGTTQNYIVTATVAPSSAKAITSFKLVDKPGVITGLNIAVTLPMGTDITSLAANFITTGANVTVGGVTQISNVTTNNFSTPVSYVVTAGDGSTATYTVTVTLVQYYVYVTDLGSSSISMYSFDGGTGLLTPLPTPTISAGGSFPYAITSDPSGHYVYVTNSGSDTVSMFSVDSATGQLSHLTPSTINTGATPRGITFDPSGRYLYVVDDNDDKISMYSVDSSTGLLTHLSTPTVATGNFPFGITFDPSGHYVYVASINENSIYMYSFNENTGLLTPLSTPSIIAGTAPSNLAFTPDGNYLYAVNGGDGTVSMYSANSSTGQLTSLSPATVGVGNAPQGIIVDQSGLYVYVVNISDSTVSMNSLDTSNGQLTPLSPSSTVGAGPAPFYIAQSPTGSYVYVTNSGDNTVSMYSKNPVTGELTLLSPTPTVGTGVQPIGITFVPPR